MTVSTKSLRARIDIVPAGVFNPFILNLYFMAPQVFAL